MCNSNNNEYILELEYEDAIHPFCCPEGNCYIKDKIQEFMFYRGLIGIPCHCIDGNGKPCGEINFVENAKDVKVVLILDKETGRAIKTNDYVTTVSQLRQHIKDMTECARDLKK